MKLLKYLSVAAVVCLIGSTGRPEDKPDYAKLIIGKWEVAKADPGTAPVGSIIEFLKDGKIKGSLKIGDKTDTFEGMYTLDGDKLKLKVDDDKEKDAVTIVKISETELNIKDKDGKELRYSKGETPVG